MQTKIALMMALMMLSAASAQNGTRGYRIHLEKTGWGEASLNDIKAVLHSSCDSIHRHFADLKEKEVIYVRRNKSGPITLFKRNLRGEVIVELNTGDRFWCQYSYQMAHEFCHVLCRFRPGSQRNLWFEETLCELASIFSLRAMAKDWKTNAPYPNWKGYSEAIHDYVSNLEKQFTMPDGMTLVDYYKEQAEALRKNPTDRPVNGKVALALLSAFETNPEHWPAVAYLNSGKGKDDISFANYLRNWNEQAPPKHSIFIHSIARHFGIDLYRKATQTPPLKKTEIGLKPQITVVGSGIEGSITVNAGDKFSGKLAFEPGTIHVSGVDGKPLSSDESGLESAKTFATEKVKTVHFTKVEAETAAPEEKGIPPHQRRIWLTGGSLVVGEMTHVDSKSITLKIGTGLTILPRAAVAVIDMGGGTVEGEWRLMLEETPPGYLLENNNFVEAKLEGTTKKGEFTTWSPIFGRKEVALSRVRAVKLASIHKRPPKEFKVSTHSGSMILADSIISKGARLIIRDNSRYFLNILASEVLEIRQAGG
ncbi:MAG: hypothetical protein GY899_13960 [Verrucomicrobiaceae bacterium]|nr:hypothetical protein [Verrucomicrobiaceae bacterium]